MGDWLPISTYDGSFAVLLYDASVGQFVGGKDAHGWYIRGDGTEYYEEGALNPTHWKPLEPDPNG